MLRPVLAKHAQLKFGYGQVAISAATFFPYVKDARGRFVAPRKNEAVAASFHYMCKVVVEKGKPKEVPFSPDDFSQLFEKLKAKPPLDTDDEAALDRVRMRLDAPLESVAKENDNTIFGRFFGSYWGHAYNNTEKGKISAESVSLRPFFFILYRAKNGRIYIGSQYLGLFGGYGALERTLRGLLDANDRVDSHSLRLSGVHYKDVKPKEVQVRFASKPKNINEPNKITNKGLIVLKKAGKNDGFEDEVAKKLIPFIGRPQGVIKKQVADILNESNLIDVNDADIVDCTVVGDLNGRRQTIYMIDTGSFATRFPLDVRLDADGHPVAAQAKAAMLKVLADEIMARE